MSKTISFCTNCKGRLWQLQQTLPSNLKVLEEGCDIVLLDYQSPDGLRDWIFNTFASELVSGKLKYFLLKNDFNYSCAYAKNVAHKLATGDILFNLDGDNFIQSSLIQDLSRLDDKTILLPKIGEVIEGTNGRLGYTKATFLANHGYNETIEGMGNDDGELITRFQNTGMSIRIAQKHSGAIQNTQAQKDQYLNVTGLTNPPIDYPATFGKATVEDKDGHVFDI